MAFLEVPAEIAPSRNQNCFGKRQWCSFKSLRDLSFRSAAWPREESAVELGWQEADSSPMNLASE